MRKTLAQLPRIASLAGLAGFFLLMAISVKTDYDGATAQARQEVSNISRLMEFHTAATLRGVDLVLMDIIGHVRPADMTQSPRLPDRQGNTAPVALDRLLLEKQQHLKEIHSLHIFNAQGECLYSSLTPLPQFNIGDRPHFLRQQQEPATDEDLVISEPMVGRLTGRWTLALARRISDGEGHFLGVVTATFLPESLETFYGTLDLGPRGLMNIRYLDARLLARHPSRPDQIGIAIPDHPMLPRIAAGDREMDYDYISPLDGIRRIHHTRQVGNTPLYVSAGMAVEDYLAPWRQKFVAYGLGGLVLTLLVVTLGGLARRGEADRARTQQALAESEARYRVLLEHSPVGIFHFDDQLRITFCNGRFAEILGTTPERLHGLNMGSLRDARILPCLRATLEGAGGHYEGEYLTSISHTALHIDMRTTSLRDDTGKLLGAIGVVDDVSERWQAAEKLSTSERSFRTLADFTYDWEYWQGVDGRIIYMTPSVERITGYPPEVFVGNPEMLLQIVHGDDRPQVLAHLCGASNQDNDGVDFRIVRRDGQIRWIAHGCRAVSGEGGEALGRRVSNRDITERKQLEAALQQLNRDLEERVREAVAQNREKDQLLIQQSRLAAMGEMVHNIAHQWRQPLNALGLVIANIKDDYTYGEMTEATLAESVDRALKLLQKMSGTIDDFRNFFRPDREPGDFDLARAVEDALFIMEASLQNNAISVSRTLTPGLRAWGFPGQFSQAILNLVANAKEAIQEHHVSPGLIAISLSATDGQAEVWVEDNGGGIPAEIRPRIFDPYFTTKPQGSGIGLYMTRMILERSMHGRIRVESLAYGSRFVITIPLTLARTAPE